MCGIPGSSRTAFRLPLYRGLYILRPADPEHPLIVDASAAFTAQLIAKRPGAYKIQHLLEREYGIKISAGRVYRLMKGMNLPKMSTAIRPKSKKRNARTI